MSLLTACFRAAEKGEVQAEPEQESESESASNADEVEEEDEATKQENKIELAKKSFIDKLHKLEPLFKNNVHLISTEIQRIEAKGRGLVIGSSGVGDEKKEGDYLYAKSVSCYPLKPKKTGDPSDEEGVKLGDPICDVFGYEVYESKNIIMSIADGCNWGPKPFEAARIAVTVFHEEMSKKLGNISTVRKTGKLLIRAFMSAHTRILQAPLKRGINDIWETGTTTLLGGVVLSLTDGKTPYVFIAASVGDCKAFHISVENGRVTDLTRGTRPPSSVTNVNDPGGRLGPYVGKEGSADLRNLGLMVAFCDEGDVIFVCSDGVYDNLDPQQLNISCRDLGVDAEEWESAPVHQAEKVKDEYRCKFIQKMIVMRDDKDTEWADELPGPVTFVPLEEFADSLLGHVFEVTDYSRKWMEEHPTARMPDARSKKKDPNFLGKMDHTTCMLVKVGFNE